MALNSPGVEVTIIDQSQYLPAAPNSVPLILLATAQNKATPAGTAIAPGTTAANAGKLYAVTSQRDLVNLFGTPFFYKTTNGTPIQGYELNEYGLQTAYSILGSTNLAYVVRADIDLAALIGTTGRPSSEPAAGTAWVSTTASGWGIREFNLSTGRFTTKIPTVIVDPADVNPSSSVVGAPQQYVGMIGDYAINESYNYGGATSSYATNTTRWDAPQPDTYASIWYKAGANIPVSSVFYNNWVAVGSGDWYEVTPVVIGTTFAPVTTPGGSVTFSVVHDNGNGGSATDSFTVDLTTADVDPVVVAQRINSALQPLVNAWSLNSKIYLSFSSTVTSVNVTTSSTDIANQIGFGSQGGTSYNSLAISYATNAGMPLWTSTDSTPRPTGSVWVLTNTSSGLGVNLNTYNATTAAWNNVSNPVSTSDWVYTNAIDSTGGKNIPAGSWYTQVTNQGNPSSPIQLWQRSTTGPAVFTGTRSISTASLSASTEYFMNVYVSVPGQSTLAGPYYFNSTTVASGSALAGQGAADWFVQNLLALNIPNFTASSAGTYVTITHTEGGTIVFDPVSDTLARPLAGVSIIGTAGQLTCTAVDPTEPLRRGDTVVVGGTVQGTGSITPGTYKITATNGVNSFTLGTNATMPAPITTVAGTTTGLTFTNDHIGTNNPLTPFGFTLPTTSAGTTTPGTPGAKFGPYSTVIAGTGLTVVAVTGAGNDDATVSIETTGTVPTTIQIDPAGGGTGYATGDSVSVTDGDGVIYLFKVAAATGGVITQLSWLGYNSAPPTPVYTVQLSNWQVQTYTPNEIAITTPPLNGTYWYYSTAGQVDIMVNKNVSAAFTGSVTSGTLNVTATTSGTIVQGMQIYSGSTLIGTVSNFGTGTGGIGSYPLSSWDGINYGSGTLSGSKGASWIAYNNTTYGTNGLPTIAGSTSGTNPTGPIISASEPALQTDGTPLVYGDLWIDSGDLENYPVIRRYQSVDSVNQWVLIDNADQQTQNGIVFADARWAPNGTVDVIDDPIPTITSLLTSNYLDLDAPDASLYPQGTLLFNTRRSGYNVKQYAVNYFSAQSYPDQTLPQEPSTWVSAGGLMPNGAPYMGRKAQRNIVVQAMKSAIDTNTNIREEDTFINLLACPNYPELQQNMITLNNDRNNTSYIVGDTPLRLPANATDILAWATNAAGATATGDEGLVSRDTYMGLYYPSAIGSDLTGAQVVLPSSYMMLKTMLYNDTVAYPWFAPAGQRRGVVSNVTNIGYLDGDTGEFVTDKNRVALRDIEYQQFINPIAYFSNVGILNYGNKNSFDSQSALDRTNVARLICYLRYNLQRAVRPFLFEPNDAFTRGQVRGVVQTLLADVQSKRGIYDYLVICDDTNNTPARIDRNELWIDVAIEPVKAVEFIYIPVRILNTGEIAGLQ